MRNQILFFIIFYIFLNQTSCLSTQEKSGKNTKPLIVIIETDPSLAIPGADMPRLVLYDDGTLIYRKRDGECTPSYYVKKNLEKAILKKIRTSVALTKKFRELKSVYDLTLSTHAMSVDICIFENKLSKAVSVYGFLIPDLPRKYLQDKPEYSLISNAQYSTNQILRYPPSDDLSQEFLRPIQPDQLPEEFKRIYAYMLNFTNCHDAEVWFPDYIEIFIWPSSAKKEKMNWPEKWPSINDPSAKNRGNSLYSVYMPYDKFNDFNNFLKKLYQKNATILLNGKTWSIAYRFAFPSESVWMKLLYPNYTD